MDAENKSHLLKTLLFWGLLYVLWIAVFQNRTITISRSLGVEFCYLVFVAFNFYFNTKFTFPRYLHKRKYFLFAVTGLLFIIITAGMRAVVAYYINVYAYHVPGNEIHFPQLYLNSLLNIFIWTECLVAGKLMLDKLQVQRYAEAVEKEKIVNELSFLKEQINPHFLFNSLNSVYFQIDKNNTAARKTLMGLSEMLRYQLYECNAPQIPIDKEIAYLRNYMELQKLRLNTNYTSSFDVQPAVKDFTIAPLLIIPLIENAFKYVSHFSDKGNEIMLSLSCENDWFICNIVNTIECIPLPPVASAGGIGLKNLERRLELLYPEKHELIFKNTETHYSVALKIKIHAN